MLIRYNFAMPKQVSIPPGNFGWLELATSDQAGGKEFYCALFGWEFMDVPMGPDATYTIFSLKGSTVAAGYQLGSEMQSRGIPPHWLLYVAVSNADSTAAKVEPAGGLVVMPPFDVMDQVRIAVLQDPTGAYFSISQPMKNTGLELINEPGSLVWADLASSDAERAAKFYVDVFGWTTYVEGSPYIHFKNGETYVGGSMPGVLPAGIPAHWMPYIGVNNLAASVSKAESLGAKVLMPAHTMEGVGSFSAITDPQGAAISLFEAEKR
jgi:hypothetical protein